MTGDQVMEVVAAVHEVVGRDLGCDAAPGRPDHDDNCQAIAGDLLMVLRRRGLTLAKSRIGQGRKARR